MVDNLNSINEIITPLTQGLTQGDSSLTTKDSPGRSASFGNIMESGTIRDISAIWTAMAAKGDCSLHTLELINDAQQGNNNKAGDARGMAPNALAKMSDAELQKYDQNNLAAFKKGFQELTPAEQDKFNNLEKGEGGAFSRAELAYLKEHNPGAFKGALAHNETLQEMNNRGAGGAAAADTARNAAEPGGEQQNRARRAPTDRGAGGSSAEQSAARHDAAVEPAVASTDAASHAEAQRLLDLPRMEDTVAAIRPHIQDNGTVLEGPAGSINWRAVLSDIAQTMSPQQVEQFNVACANTNPRLQIREMTEQERATQQALNPNQRRALDISTRQVFAGGDYSGFPYLRRTDSIPVSSSGQYDGPAY